MSPSQTSSFVPTSTPDPRTRIALELWRQKPVAGKTVAIIDNSYSTSRVAGFRSSQDPEDIVPGIVGEKGLDPHKG